MIQHQKLRNTQLEKLHSSNWSTQINISLLHSTIPHTLTLLYSLSLRLSLSHTHSFPILVFSGQLTHCKHAQPIHAQYTYNFTLHIPLQCGKFLSVFPAYPGHHPIVSQRARQRCTMCVSGCHARFQNKVTQTNQSH